MIKENLHNWELGGFRKKYTLLMKKTFQMRKTKIMLGGYWLSLIDNSFKNGCEKEDVFLQNIKPKTTLLLFVDIYVFSFVFFSVKTC